MLCQATILPVDREIMKSRRVTDMLSFFYPTMIQVSSPPSFLIILLFFYHFILLTTSLFLAADLQYVRAGGRVSEVQRSPSGLEE